LFSIFIFLGHELPFVIKMNFLRESGRSIQQDDNSYKFILIQKNNSTRTSNLANLTNNSTSTIVNNNNNISKHPSAEQKINLNKESTNLKIQQQSQSINGN